MLRSLLRKDKQKPHSVPSPPLSTFNRASSTRSTPISLSPTLVSVLPFVLPFIDRPSLLALCLLNRQFNSIVSPELYHTVQLHNARSYVTFLGQSQRLPAGRVKHLSLILDVEFASHPPFAQLCESVSISSTSTSDVKERTNWKGSRSWAKELETVHLTTAGGPCYVSTRTSTLGIRREEGYWLNDLVRIWLGRVLPSTGPKHFRWRHVNSGFKTNNPSKSDGDTVLHSEGFPNEKGPPAYLDNVSARQEEAPFPPFRWIFSFLSDWTTCYSLDLPLTSESINEGFKLSNLDLQVLQYISFAGQTLTRPLLAGILWEVTRGKRSRKREKLVLDIRKPVPAEMDEGLRKLIDEEDEELLEVRIDWSVYRTEEEWRQGISRKEWPR